MYYMLPIYPWVPKSLPRFDLWHLPQPAQALAAIEEQGTPYAWAAGGSHSRNRVGNQITYIYIHSILNVVDVILYMISILRTMCFL